MGFSEEYERLGELYAGGKLSDEEFAEAKQRLLDGVEPAVAGPAVDPAAGPAAAPAVRPATGPEPAPDPDEPSAEVTLARPATPSAGNRSLVAVMVGLILLVPVATFLAISLLGD